MSKNDALSDFLTRKRASITPAEVGIPDGGSRRVPGLRREEVAVLAGVSVDWYARLEQGRPVTPSEQVLAAIARILRLDDAEREYLSNLARPVAGLRRETRAPVLRPGVHRMLAALDNQAAFVLGPRMEVLAGNELAWALLHDFPAQPVGERNLLRWILTCPDARDLYGEWETVAAEMVGVLQLEASGDPNSPPIAALVRDLEQRSAEFRIWWSRPNPKGRTSGVKHFQHGIVGPVTIDWEAFTVPDDSTQTLFIYTAADQPSSDALRMLASWRASRAANGSAPTGRRP